MTYAAGPTHRRGPSGVPENFADRAFSRVAGAPLIAGNAVRVMKDASENYPAWEAAMREARRSVHVEMYIFHDDATGRRFRDLLVQKAREGVEIRVLYDWLGSWKMSSRFYRPLLEAGVLVRPMNPPRFHNLGRWSRRDHRKLIVTDGAAAFVGGLCIGAAWEGEPEKGLAPWRDTGVEIRGPAVAEAERAFAESWRIAGGPAFPQGDGAPPPAGDVALRLISTAPGSANILALDLLVASLARRQLWITDAYFVASTPYLQALQRAARDGVDVRLLLPATSDMAWVSEVSRLQYRPLLEAGVRVFEWNGSVLHAKTAVMDGLWARIGSTNLNVTSWLGNWEMDVAIEDAGIAEEMEELFEDDLESATEVVLRERRRFGRPLPRVGLAEERRHTRGERLRRARSASVRRFIGHGARLRAGLRAAVTGSRTLEAYERRPVLVAALLLVALASAGFWAPALLAYPLAALCAGLGAYLLVRLLPRRRPASPSSPD
jgi:phosphatidylserine/phosphatidylglycerophosphate/cardiolipin synthase-like enzyme